MKHSKRNTANADAKAKRDKPDCSKYASKGGRYDYSELYIDKPQPRSNRR